MSELDEIVAGFLVESDENLLALERDPGDLEVVSSVLRRIHTVRDASWWCSCSSDGPMLPDRPETQDHRRRLT